LDTNFGGERAFCGIDSRNAKRISVDGDWGKHSLGKISSERSELLWAGVLSGLSEMNQKCRTGGGGGKVGQSENA